MGNVNHMAASKSSSKITEKLNLQPVLNIELFLTHMELELDMLAAWYCRKAFERCSSPMEAEF
jgi:hypothetical protein